MLEPSFRAVTARQLKRRVQGLISQLNHIGFVRQFYKAVIMTKRINDHDIASVVYSVISRRKLVTGLVERYFHKSDIKLPGEVL